MNSNTTAHSPFGTTYYHNVSSHQEKCKQRKYASVASGADLKTEMWPRKWAILLNQLLKVAPSFLAHLNFGPVFDSFLLFLLLLGGFFLGCFGSLLLGWWLGRSSFFLGFFRRLMGLRVPVQRTVILVYLVHAGKYTRFPRRNAPIWNMKSRKLFKQKLSICPLTTCYFWNHIFNYIN